MNKYSSLLELIHKTARDYSDLEAFVIRRRVRKEKVFYHELPALMMGAERFFKREKISVDSKVLIWGGNCQEYSTLLLALWSLGRVAVPVDYRNSSETIEKIIEKTELSTAFASKYFNFDFLVKKGIKVYYLEDFLREIRRDKPSHVSEYKTLKANKRYVDPKRICQIIYTSGTTGIPKGVLIRQDNLLTNVAQVLAVMPKIAKPRTVSILPLSHMFEQVAGLLLPMLFGTTIFYLPRVNSYQMLAAFVEYRPTHLLFVPQLLKIIYEKIESKAVQAGKLPQFRSLQRISRYLPVTIRRMIFGQIDKMFGGSLEYIASGGAPLPVETSRHWWALGFPVIEGYGATEATAAATMNPIDEIRPGSVGKIIPGVEVNISKDGEIVIGGPSVTAGYYGMPEKTKEVFTKTGYRTGDIGRFDKDGYLYITGRDAFKIVLPSGEKVYVEDVESKAMKDKRIREVCIVGKKTASGEVIHGYFILRDDVSESLEKIVNSINENLESKQQILSYELWKDEDFPRTPTLKVDRKSLINLANKIIIKEEIKSTTNSAYSDIIDILAKVAGVERKRLDDKDRLTTDLGLDSLGRMELVAMAEEYLGLAIDETKITPKTTVADLAVLSQQGLAAERVWFPTWPFTVWGEVVRELVDRLILLPFHASLIKIKYPQRKVPKIVAGSIIVFNHPGIMDAVCALRTIAPYGSMKFVTNAAAAFWENKSGLRKPIEMFVGGVPLYDSGQKLAKVLQLDSDLLDRGYNLLFAPQGELQRTNEEVGFKPGLGYIVQMLDRPVSIVKIKGYREIWPAPEANTDKARLTDMLPKKRGAVEVVVSKSIKEDWQELSPIQITNFLEEEYRKL